MSEILTLPELPDVSDSSPTKKRKSSPRKLSRLMEFLKESTDLLVKLSVIAGVLFTAYQYLESLRKDRIQRSFELVDLWESDRVQAAHRTLETQLNGLRAEASKILGAQADANELALAEKIIGDSFLKKSSSDDDVRNDFNTVLYFLNRVSYCATSKLCEKDVLNDFFRDYASQFWAYFGENLSSSVSGTHPIKKYLDTPAN